MCIRDRLCGADGTAVTLAAPEETAAVARGWGRDEVRTLEIDFALTEGTQPRLLTVELPLGLAFVPEGLPTGDVPELAAVDYTPCTLPAGYTADATGGTLRCTCLLYTSTKGDANNAEDAEPVLPQQVQGIWKGGRIGGAGNAVLFLSSTTGMLLFIVCPILLLIVWDIITRRKADKNEKARADALEAELKALRAAQGVAGENEHRS